MRWLILGIPILLLLVTFVSAQDCVPEWACEPWSECTDAVKTRTCTDINQCGTEEGVPALQETCEIAPAASGFGWEIILALIVFLIIVLLVIFFIIHTKRKQVEQKMAPQSNQKQPQTSNKAYAKKITPPQDTPEKLPMFHRIKNVFGKKDENFDELYGAKNKIPPRS